MRELLHRGRLEDRAVAAEQERRFEVHQDARFGSPRVGDLLELLGPLVEVIADGAAGDPAHDGADGRSFTVPPDDPVCVAGGPAVSITETRTGCAKPCAFERGRGVARPTLRRAQCRPGGRKTEMLTGSPSANARDWHDPCFSRRHVG